MSCKAVTELGGGVSNTVLLVESPERRLVLKQALGKLRVEQDWFSDRTRIFREALALRLLGPPLSGGVPQVLFEDRENCLFGMEAAPLGSVTWKQQLLSGEVSTDTAGGIGEMLAAIGRHTWGDPRFAAAFGDQTVFDQLRLDPYYRSTASRHPDLAPWFDSLLAETCGRRVCLVHGDWSPKNFLIVPGRVIAIDFEVIHYGDPAFDTAFLLNHLLLKSIYRPQWKGRYRDAAGAFWTAYTSGLLSGSAWIEAATLRHLPGLLLARIDGKSPVEYIRDPELKQLVRQRAIDMMRHPPASVAGVFA